MSGLAIILVALVLEIVPVVRFIEVQVSQQLLGDCHNG